jgi:hypothetical protein
MELQTIGKVLVIVGIGVLVLGALLWLAGSWAPLQNLLSAGTLRAEAGGVTCLVPILASILISIVGTVVLNIIIRLINK